MLGTRKLFHPAQALCRFHGCHPLPTLRDPRVPASEPEHRHHPEPAQPGSMAGIHKERRLLLMEFPVVQSQLPLRRAELGHSVSLRHLHND